MRKRVSWMAAAVAGAALLVSTTAGAATPVKPAAAKPRAAAVAPEDTAQAAAEKWLTLMETAKYGDAWDASAKVFRDSVPRDQFTSGASSQRSQLGRTLSRTLKSRAAKDSMPNAPKGQYMVVEYVTDYSQEKVTEIVALTAEAGGAWRVSGYQVSSR
jgi:hypothetical protein